MVRQLCHNFKPNIESLRRKNHNKKICSDEDQTVGVQFMDAV